MKAKAKLLIMYLPAAVMLGYAFTCAADTHSWPAVKPVQHVFKVENVQKMNIALLIHSKRGRPLYRLRCAHPGYAGNYSGDFECRLDTVQSGDVKVAKTLLVEDARQTAPQGKAWPSRGRFFAIDLVGACAHIPQFGVTRSFRLRGMKLTLQVMAPTVDTLVQGQGGTDDPTLKAMRLKVTVKPDPSAHRSIAAIVPFPKHTLPQCGINPGKPIVGHSFGILTFSKASKDMSYFGNPATFLAGPALTPVDWKTVPFSKPNEWNQSMRQTKTAPSQCSARLYFDATFRGTLVARQFHVHVPRSSTTRPGTATFSQAVLKLDHPINVCFSVFPNPQFSKFATPQDKASFVHVTALLPSLWDLTQLEAFNQKYISHRVEIWGRAGGMVGTTSVQYNLPPLIVDRICLLQHGKPFECSPQKHSSL